MTSTKDSSGKAPLPVTVEMKLEMAVMPVSDAERAKEFYANLGWRLDADFVISDDFRVVQFTPPGSQASILFGTGVKTAGDGSAESCSWSSATSTLRVPISTLAAWVSARSSTERDFALAPRAGLRAQTRRVARTRRSPRSAIGRKSVAASRNQAAPARAAVVFFRRMCRGWLDCCTRPPNTTTRMKIRMLRTTGGTGMQPISTLASRAARLKRRRRPLDATWKGCSMQSRSRVSDIRSVTSRSVCWQAPWARLRRRLTAVLIRFLGRSARRGGSVLSATADAARPRGAG